MSPAGPGEQESSLIALTGTKSSSLVLQRLGLRDRVSPGVPGSGLVEGKHGRRPRGGAAAGPRGREAVCHQCNDTARPESGRGQTRHACVLQSNSVQNNPSFFLNIFLSL